MGSPPSDEFSSLLNTSAEAREVSKLRTEKIEPQIRACVESYKLQMEMRKHRSFQFFGDALGSIPHQ